MCNAKEPWRLKLWAVLCTAGAIRPPRIAPLNTRKFDFPRFDPRVCVAVAPT